MNKSLVIGHLCAFSADSCWGLMSPVAKAIMLGGIISPIVLTDLRMVGAALLFWTLSCFLPKERVEHKDMMKIFIASLLGIVFNQTCFIFGVSLTTPADASILTTSMPLWVMILSAYFLKEPITGKKVLGLASGAGGALLLILGSSGMGVQAHVSGANSMLGNVLVVLAQLCYAAYLVFFSNFIRRYSLVTIMKWMFTFASIAVIPFSASSLMSTKWQSLNAVDLAMVCYVVAGATFLAQLLLVKAQKTLSPNVTGMYNYVQPLVASIVAVIWGLDSFNVVKVVAVLLICVGVYLVTTAKARHCPEIPKESVLKAKR